MAGVFLKEGRGNGMSVTDLDVGGWRKESFEGEDGAADEGPGTPSGFRFIKLLSFLIFL